MTRRGEILLVAKDGIKMTHAVEPRLLVNFMRIVEPLALFVSSAFFQEETNENHMPLKHKAQRLRNVR